MTQYLGSVVLLSFIMAHISSNLLLHRFRQMNMSDPPPPPEPHASDKSDSEDYYRPTPTDVIVAHIMLTRSIKLPWELVDSIFDMAEYWAHSINVIEYQAEQQDHLRISGSSGMQDRFLVSHSASRVRPILFTRC